MSDKDREVLMVPVLLKDFETLRMVLAEALDNFEIEWADRDEIGSLAADWNEIGYSALPIEKFDKNSFIRFWDGLREAVVAGIKRGE